jgi:hypothetical protein
MTKNCRALLALVWIALVLVPVSGFAQSSGTIRGVVKDPSGAVLPGVNVSVTNIATQQKTETISTETGTYSFAFLPPGDYNLTAVLPGFSAFNREKIHVEVAGALVLDIGLQVEGRSENVSVMEAAQQVQTTTSSLGHLVDNTMMNAVPLSSRNFTQVLALSTGVTANVIDAGATGRNSVNISANGRRPWDNNVVLNGVNADNAMSQGFDDAPDKTGVPVPAPDAIQEFRVQTGLYDAEFGKQGGGTVNIVTKSGGNDFHGTAYEFFRNTALDANSFFQKAAGAPKPIFRQNQYGGTLGGPIQRNKSFFFVSYQGTDQANGISATSNKTTFVPILGDRTRQTLGALYGGKPGLFGGVNVANDGSNINPVAIALLNARLPNGNYAIPDPQVITSAESGYTVQSAPAIFHEKQLIANGDVLISSKQRLSLKTLYSRGPTELPFQTSTTLLGFGENDYHSNVNLALSDTYTISPKMVNELRIGWSKNFVYQQPIEPLTARQLGITPPAELDGMPSISVSGLFNVGTNRNNDQIINQKMAEVADTLSWVVGRHQLRFGGSINPTRIKYSDLFAQRGEINIPSFRDFLLGMSAAQNGSAQSNLSQTLAGNGRPAVYPAMNNFSGFIQDDLRANDRLNLNLGLRYQFNGQAYTTDGRESNWDLRLFPKEGPPPEGTLMGLVVPGNIPDDIPLPAGVTKRKQNTLVDKQNWLGFSPRIGLAWRPIASKQNVVLRAGYGLFWSAVTGTYSIGVSAQQPFYASVVAGGASNNTTTLQNPFPNVPPITAFPIFIPVKLGSNPTVYPYSPELKQPHTNEYSANLQMEIKGVLVQGGYVGSRTKNIVGFVALNQAYLASPERPIHGQTTNTLANRALRVPFIGFTPGNDGIGVFSNVSCLDDCLTNPYKGRPFWSRYHSFQVSGTKRYSAGLSFSAAYTYANARDNINGNTSGRQQSLGGVTGDYHDPRVGPSNFIRTHVFTSSYLWQLPSLNTDMALARVLINGWSLSGVVIGESGLPFNITDSRGGTIYGASSFAQFATGVTAADVKLDEPTLKRYFNTGVFALPPAIGDGTGIGNAPRNFMVGPSFWNADIALSKNFPLREPVTLEFRSEFFNLFNHPNFSNPGSNVATPASFGVISSTANAPRIVQLALRLRF